MKIKCPQCDTHYDVSDEIANTGAQVQCAKCDDIFTAAPVSEAEISPEIAPENTAEITPEPETAIENDFDNDISFAAIDEPEPDAKNEDTNAPDFDGDIAFEAIEDAAPEPEPASDSEPSSDLLTNEEKDFFTSFGNKLAVQEEAEEQSPPVEEPVEKPVAADEGIDIGWDETEDQDDKPQLEAAKADPFETAESSPDEELFANADMQAATVPEPAAKAEPEAVETRDEPATSRFPTPVLMGWGALAASLVLIVLGATFLRVPIVKAVPGMAGLYEKAGYPVNIRGLEFYGLSHQWVNEHGRMHLVVRGEIVNITDKPVFVPEIVFAMLDASGMEFFQWTQRSKTGQLAPLARTRFRAGIPAPVDRVRQLKIRFAKRQKSR